MLTNRRSTIRECDVVLFVERASELLYAARLRRSAPEPQGNRVLTGRKIVVWSRPETGRPIHGQVEVAVRRNGGPNQTYVEKCGDDLWIAEKFQSSSEIAGSPRNSFSTGIYTEVEH